MDMVKRVFIEPTQPYKSWTMRATKFNKWNIFWVKNAFAADAHQARIVSNKPFSFSWKQSFHNYVGVRILKQLLLSLHTINERPPE